MSEINRVDELILRTLRTHGQLTTYKLARLIGVTWSTVNSHCYKLKAMGVVDARVEVSRFGRKKVLWELKA